jgi:hypothetical protein
MVLGEPLFDHAGYCQRHAGTEVDGPCVHTGGCTLRALWQTLEHWMRHTLDRITLADLLQGEADVVALLRARLSEVVAQPATPLLALGTVPSARPVAAPAPAVAAVASGA